MPRWLAPLLRRIHRLAAEGRVSMTLKALRELVLLELGLDEQDACDVLASLGSKTPPSGASPRARASGSTSSDRTCSGGRST
jgi:hypothetical protein